jgi:hypothetical protein
LCRCQWGCQWGWAPAAGGGGRQQPLLWPALLMSLLLSLLSLSILCLQAAAPLHSAAVPQGGAAAAALRWRQARRRRWTCGCRLQSGQIPGESVLSHSIGQLGGAAAAAPHTGVAKKCLFHAAAQLRRVHRGAPSHRVQMAWKHCFQR